MFFEYLAAALAFSLLSLYLLPTRRNAAGGWLMFLGCAATALSDVGAVFEPVSPTAKILFEFFGVLQNLVWLTFFLRVFAAVLDSAVHQWFNRLVVGFFVLSATLVAYSMLFNEQFLGLSLAIIILTKIVQASLGLVLLEQIFRNFDDDALWGVKFACFGVGLMFAWDFFVYSQMLLYVRIDETLLETGWIPNVAAAALIFASARRKPKWETRLKLSRKLVFHTFSMLVAGAYLILVSMVGYYVRHFGNQLWVVYEVLFLTAAGTLFLTTFFSGTFRARLRVFVSKHFFTHQFDYREEWLRFTSALTQADPEEHYFETGIRAMAGLLSSPGGQIWLSRENGDYECVGRWNMPANMKTISKDDPAIGFMEQTQWVIDLVEYRANPAAYCGLCPPEAIEHYDAGIMAPLFIGGDLCGFLLLAKSMAKNKLNWETRDLIKTACHQMASYIAQKIASEKLLEAKQFESFSRMSAFIVHDLKNLIAQLSMVTENARIHKANPEFQQDAAETIENSVRKMHKMLVQLGKAGSGEERAGRVSVTEALKDAVESKAALKPRPTLSIESNLEIIADRERLSRIFGHVIQNACEATPYSGTVSIVAAKADPGEIVVRIRDTGKGMEEEFIKTRLFKPFDTTKRAGMGVGAYECKEYVKDLGGRIEVDSFPEKGTEIRMYFQACA